MLQKVPANMEITMKWVTRISTVLSSVRQRLTGTALLLLASLAVCSAAHAQVPQLFEPLPAAAVAAANSADPAQAQSVARIQARPTSGSVTLMRLNAAALASPIVAVNLAADTSINIRHNRSEVVGRNTVVWTGTIPDVPGEVTFVVQDGNITGSVNNNGDLYRIEPVGNGVHALVKVDRSRLPPDHPPSFREKEQAAPGPASAPRAGTRGMIDRANPNGADAFPGDGRPVVIDVLVAYTTAAGGAVTNINSTIALAVAEANQSYLNSGINIRLNLADTMSVAYAESGKTFETILADLVANADVRNRRNDRAADLVAMIINKSDFCGLADAIRASADTAYAVVYFDCATGYYSFAHELGHLMGARHDPTHDATTTPFAYGHGYQYVSGTTRWRTIMAYDCAGGCPRLQYFSNPAVSYGGVSMGTLAIHNNARVLNETAPAVASFRSALVACNVFNDGYSSSAGPTDALYFRSNGTACKPDGTAAGTCRKWFGRCTAAGTDASNFSVFDNGYTNATANVDAVYFQQPQKACIPDGTPSGKCRRWVGRARTTSGKPVQCYVFNDGYTSVAGPSDAVYARSANSVCIPDGTANGTCRRWFGRCTAR